MTGNFLFPIRIDKVKDCATLTKKESSKKGIFVQGMYLTILEKNLIYLFIC